MSVNINNYEFSNPVKMDDFEYAEKKGIYIILYEKYKENLNMAYIGQSDNLAERGLPWNHTKIDKFKELAGKKNNLYISFHNMPHSTPNTRQEIERELIKEYKPPCNEYLLNG